jgi:phage FluMu protein Com
LIEDPDNVKFGLECGKLLMKKNSAMKVAGEIVCPRCKTHYEIKDNKISIINKEVEENGNRERK